MNTLTLGRSVRHSRDEGRMERWYLNEMVDHRERRNAGGNGKNNDKRPHYTIYGVQVAKMLIYEGE